MATKVGKYKAGEPEDFSAERVKRSVHESLQRLGAAETGAFWKLIHCCMLHQLAIRGTVQQLASFNFFRQLHRPRVHRLDSLS